MRITSLIDNESRSEACSEHGLSLHLELASGLRVLFDMGQGSLFAENARKLHVDLSQVDVAVVSHGHYDHGGGLPVFLSLNGKACVYVHKEAFLPHYSLREEGLTFIGLDASVRDDARLVFCDDVTEISPELILFSHVTPELLVPSGNGRLLGPDKKADAFRHEQNLIVREGECTFLFAGCAHQGILNIMAQATRVLDSAPSFVFAGMHLMKSGLPAEEQSAYVSQLAQALARYKGTKFFTMHCTGLEAYRLLREALGSQISYLSCGESIEL